MARNSTPKTDPKAKEQVQVLVLAALDMLDCADLTPRQRLQADEIYDLANQLEDMLEHPEDEEGK